MDKVRFGRALGYGARQAVKTLVTAVDAATADDPSGKNMGSGQRVAGNTAGPAPASAPIVGRSARTAPDTPARKAAYGTAKTVVQAREVKKGLRRGSKRFGEAMWGPFVRLSGVLWLEVSGVFFGLFAVVALAWGWKMRGAWRSTATNAADHQRLMAAVAMLILFGYFCVSSFVRARRRERRR